MASGLKSQTGSILTSEESQSVLAWLEASIGKLTESVEAIHNEVRALSGRQNDPGTPVTTSPIHGLDVTNTITTSRPLVGASFAQGVNSSVPTRTETSRDHTQSPPSRSSLTSRIILTTYPGQAGISPLPMNWGHSDPLQRGPVVVSRAQSTIRRRNGKGK